MPKLEQGDLDGVETLKNINIPQCGRTGARFRLRSDPHRRALLAPLMFAGTATDVPDDADACRA